MCVGRSVKDRARVGTAGWMISRIMKKKTKKERLIPLEDPSLIDQISSFFGMSQSFDWNSVFAKNPNNHVGLWCVL